MPKGVRVISWTPENDIKLFHAILAVQGVQVADAEKVAAVFGDNIPVNCIKDRLIRLRMNIKKNGVSGGATTVPKATKTKPSTTAPKGRMAKTAAKVKKEMQSETEEDDEDLNISDNIKPATPPETPDNKAGVFGTTSGSRQMTPTPSAKMHKVSTGRISKSRCSPRKNIKKDYKALEDPYLGMEAVEDGDGEKIFKEEADESEDMAAADEHFEAGFAEAEESNPDVGV